MLQPGGPAAYLAPAPGEHSRPPQALVDPFVVPLPGPRHRPRSGVYDNTGSTKNRMAYANALANQLRAIDPAIFDKGYYWPAFIEEIESGL